MKKTSLILALSFGTIFASHASIKINLKSDTSNKVMATYSDVVKLPVSDYRKLLSTTTDYKNLVIYQPFLSGDEKTNLQISFDRYIYNLKKTTKIDSVLTLSGTDYQKLIATATEYKNQVIYDPFLSGDEKTNLQVSFDRYIYNLKKSIKMDNTLAKK